MKKARGLRNNNPLNIIKSENINWKGESGNAGGVVWHRAGNGKCGVWAE